MGTPQQPQRGELQRGAHRRRPAGQVVVGDVEDGCREEAEGQDKPAESHRGEQYPVRVVVAVVDDHVVAAAQGVGRSDRHHGEQGGKPNETAPPDFPAAQDRSDTHQQSHAEHRDECSEQLGHQRPIHGTPAYPYV